MKTLTETEAQHIRSVAWRWYKAGNATLSETMVVFRMTSEVV